MLVLTVFVHLIDLCKELFVRAIAKALEDPIDSWLEEREILFFRLASGVSFPSRLLKDLEAEIN